MTVTPSAAISAASFTASSPARAAGTAGLNEDEQAQLRKLQARDREVRAHEQAHLAAAGGLAVSGAILTYQRGPDGRNYAVGGEVKISAGPGRTPEETLQRARTLRAAALAPASPSGADRAAAAQASRLEQQAQIDLSQQKQDEIQTTQARLAARYNSETPTPPQLNVLA